MPQAFNPGTGGTFQSTVLVSAFAEAAQILANRELAVEETSRPNNISLSGDLRQGTMTINATLPITIGISGTGVATITAKDYLTPLTTVGGDGTFVDGGSELGATHLVGAFWELANRVGAKDALLTNGINNVTISCDFDAGTATVNANLAITTSIDANGKPVIDVVDYL